MKVIVSLTELVLNIQKLEVFHIFVVVEEVFVDVSPSKQPDVTVVSNGAVSLVRPFQSCTLSFGFHRGYDERHPEQPQQLLIQTNTGTMFSLNQIFEH